ncbi:MAG TPA: hypothetical protein VH598_00235, partial [Verrucomicrobiae bacterium]|nr:hypothetical protein [Verrucomicrobiae bacterium]
NASKFGSWRQRKQLAGAGVTPGNAIIEKTTFGRGANAGMNRNCHFSSITLLSIILRFYRRLSTLGFHEVGREAMAAKPGTI